jgi:hypothetical protein
MIIQGDHTYMKQRKTVLALVVFLIVCASTEAQITFSAWGRAVITPLAFMGEHSATSAATSTWGDVPSISFSANGTAPSGNIGFNIDFDFGVDISTGSPAIIGDNAKAWVRPLGAILPKKFDMLKLTAGLFKEEEFRGKIGASEFASWLIYAGSPDEDNIFQRFDARAGAHFKLEPLTWWDSSWNGLNIQGAFGSNTLGAPGNNLRATKNLLNNEDNNTISEQYDENNPQYDGDRKMSAADVFKAMQIALGYRIPDVGLARIQYIGSNRNVFRWGEQGNTNGVVPLEKKLATGLQTNKDADIIEAAFLYNGMKGLIVDVGVKIPLKYTTETDFVVYPQVVGSDGVIYPEETNANNREYTIQLPYAAALGASWTPAFFDSLNLTARADFSFGGTKESESDSKKVEEGYILDIWFMPSYEIISNLKVGFDLGVYIHGRDTLTRNAPVPRAQTDVSKYVDFGIGPWFELGVMGGRVRTGAVVMIPGSPRYRRNSGSPTYEYSPILTGDPVISIPISFTYSF